MALGTGAEWAGARRLPTHFTQAYGQVAFRALGVKRVGAITADPISGSTLTRRFQKLLPHPR